MCTVIILRRPNHAYPLILAGNRDEMIDRPWRVPGRHWPDRPDVVAGMDELAGGSWLGVNDTGVVAVALNRHGSLGPKPGMRSRGELVLEALDHADAETAAAALGEIEPSAYRSFNIVVADNRDAFWIRHADPTGTLPVQVKPIPEGLSLLAAGDLDDPDSVRLRRYKPRFAAAGAPDPEKGDWSGWEKLLEDDSREPEDDPQSALLIRPRNGFATVSSSIVALPAPGSVSMKPVFRFTTRQPAPTSWIEVG